MAERFRPVFGEPHFNPQEIAASSVLHDFELIHSIPPGVKTELVVEDSEVSVRLGNGAVTKLIAGKETRVVPLSLYNGTPKPLRMNLPEANLDETRRELKIVEWRSKIDFNGKVFYEDKYPAPKETRILFFRDVKSAEIMIEDIVFPSSSPSEQQSSLFLE